MNVICTLGIIFATLIQCESYLESLDEVTEFRELLKKEENLLVLFTEECCACTDCVEAETLMGAMSATFEDNLNLKTVRLKKPNFRKVYGVKSTPTLVFIREGKPALYDGKFEQDALYFWIDDNREPLTKELDDDSFEHLTQAASGATTGDWLVMFYDESCIKNSGLLAHLEGVGTIIKRTVNIATVEMAKSPETSLRFKVKKCPELLFLRHGKMYRFNLPDISVRTMKNFAEGFYKHSKVEVIPVSTTAFDKLVDITVVYLKQYWSYMFFGLSALIFVIIVTIECFLKEKAVKKSGASATKKSN